MSQVRKKLLYIYIELGESNLVHGISVFYRDRPVKNENYYIGLARFTKKMAFCCTKTDPYGSIVKGMEVNRGLSMKKTSGFSTMELLVVVMIIMIVAAISIPNLRSALTIYRVKSSAEGLAVQINSARQQAINEGRPIMVFFDPTNARIFVDKNRNGIPDGVNSPDVQNGRTEVEEYNFSTGIVMQTFGGGSCYQIPIRIPGTVDNVPAPPGWLGISDYSTWRALVFDSRGELQLLYRQNNTLCITSSLSQNPAGAFLVYCRPGTGVSPIKFTVSVSLRGGVSVLTF